MEGTAPPKVYNSSRYSPSVADVMKVKGFMFQNFDLPIEIIDTIIDTAEYWPHTTTQTNDNTVIRAQRDRENQFILRSYPLGFSPLEYSTDDTFQMLPEFQQSYKKSEPRPWPPGDHFPVDATDVILKAWEGKSKTRGEHPCRKIVFTIRSRDQGWGGGGPSEETPYKDSFTWFDYGLERVSAFTEKKLLEAWKIAPMPQFRLRQASHSKDTPNIPTPATVCSLLTIRPETVPDVDDGKYRDPPRPNRNNIKAPQPEPTAEPPEEPEAERKFRFQHELNPDASALQKNVTANRTTKEHTIVWTCDDHINPEAVEAKALEDVGRGRETGTGEIVRNMKAGDVITVWAKARYGGWVNYVDEVKIDVYWAV